MVWLVPYHHHRTFDTFAPFLISDQFSSWTASACLAKEGFGLNQAEEIKTEGKHGVKERVVGGIIRHTIAPFVGGCFSGCWRRSTMRRDILS